MGPGEACLEICIHDKLMKRKRSFKSNKIRMPFYFPKLFDLLKSGVSVVEVMIFHFSVGCLADVATSKKVAPSIRTGHKKKVSVMTDAIRSFIQTFVTRTL